LAEQNPLGLHGSPHFVLFNDVGVGLYLLDYVPELVFVELSCVDVE
jgi:hypothetical protein